MRFATVGSNFIVDRFLSAAKLCPAFTHTAVFSRTQVRAETYAREAGATHAFWDWEAFCASDCFDAAYVASPNALHAAQASALLRAGKHVLCEKPITLDAATFEALLAEAQAHGVMIMEAMRPAHSPGIAALRALLPRVSRVRRVTLSFCKYSSRYDAFRTGVVENAFDPTLGNGALMDIGVYCVHAMQLLFGMPDRVQGSAVFLPGGVDGTGTILCDYPGMICELLYSKIADDVLPCQVQGEGGTLTFHGVTAIREIRFTPRKGDVETFTVEADEEDMHYELDAFIAAAASGIAPCETRANQDSLRSMRILDDARRVLGIDFQAK